MAELPVGCRRPGGREIRQGSFNVGQHSTDQQLKAMCIELRQFGALWVRCCQQKRSPHGGTIKPAILDVPERIAVVTGMNRPEIAAILARGEAGTSSTEHSRQRAERVLSGWWGADSEFLTPQGEPAVLRLKGARRSFEALCRRYSGEYRTGPILEELLRVRAVKPLPEGHLQALSRTYATVRWDPEGIAALGEHLSEHCATLVANLEQPTRPRLARQVALLPIHENATDRAWNGLPATTQSAGLMLSFNRGTGGREQRQDGRRVRGSTAGLNRGTMRTDFDLCDGPLQFS